VGNIKKRILIVDDEEGIRFTFRVFLEEDGYEVLTAKDYSEMKVLLKENDFDAVFADIVLEGKSGIDVLREIKQKNEICPVIMITGAPSLESAAEALRLGAYDYIQKPVTKETLLRIVKLAVQHKQLIDEKERYRSNLDAIFQGVQDGIILVDQDMKVLEANSRIEEMCGLSREMLIGKHFDSLEVNCKEHCSHIVSETLQTKEHRDAFRVECNPDQVVSISTSPLFDNQDNFLGTVVVIRDETRIVTLEKQLIERDQFYTLIGKSKKMQEIYSMIDALSNIDSTVLIIGETGTGKEMIAEAIHYKGIRNRKQLVKVNCSGLSESLLESELFGHVKGAFTGAISDRIGRFQSAEGGTLFLDEIGDTTPGFQTRLLRVLQDKEIERVGESKSIKVDVRIIAATNKDLRELIKLGKFREDLFYRLKVIEIFVPPLRERKDDIPLLVSFFIKKLNEKLHKNIRDISNDVLRAFMSYYWPGNVRELEHTLEHAMIVCKKDIITRSDLPEELSTPFTAPNRPVGIWPVEERQRILGALEKSFWNKTKAARILGMSRRTIYRKMTEYNIEEPNT
jgi:two-component system, NtrC family, response regulator HydG